MHRPPRGPRPRGRYKLTLEVDEGCLRTVPVQAQTQRENHMPASKTYRGRVGTGVTFIEWSVSLPNTSTSIVNQPGTEMTAQIFVERGPAIIQWGPGGQNPSNPVSPGSQYVATGTGFGVTLPASVGGASGIAAVWGIAAPARAARKAKPKRVKK